MQIVPRARPRGVAALAVLLALSCVTTGAAKADLFSGSRTSPASSGLFATEDWDNGGITVAWNVTLNGVKVINNVAYQVYHYMYTLTTERKDISHAIIEVSANTTKDDFFNFVFNGTPVGPKTFSPSDPGNSNPGLPGEIFGIKFDDLDGSSNVIEFDSIRAPTWGDFYAKDGTSNGNDVFAYNAGFGTDPNGNTTNFTPWISTPDTKVTPIPEPSSVAIAGLGLFGFAGYHWRRKRRTS
jgi:hypothetical protein